MRSMTYLPRLCRQTNRRRDTGHRNDTVHRYQHQTITCHAHFVADNNIVLIRM